MDTTKYMVIAKGEVITKKVVSCVINSDTKKYDITFDTGKIYSYTKQNVLFMKNPMILDPRNFSIETRD